MSEQCRGLTRAVAGLIALGMTKEMIKTTLHYDFKLDLGDSDFDDLYSQAARCVEEGLVRVRSWSTPFRPGDCNDDVVRDVGSMILRGLDLEQIVAETLRKHYMLRTGSRYRVLTQRDVEYAYDVALLCIKEKQRRAAEWAEGSKSS
ncbi:MAG: hypothetical protein RXQ79_04765 [Acidilobus sp.]